MLQPKRSIFGPAKARAKILIFPTGRPINDDDIESRAKLACAHLMSQLGYTRDEAQLIVDDYVNGSYGAWNSEILAAFK